MTERKLTSNCDWSVDRWKNIVLPVRISSGAVTVENPKFFFSNRLEIYRLLFTSKDT